MDKTEGEKIVEAFYKGYLNRSIYKTMMWMLCGIALLLGSVWITLPFSMMMESIKTGDMLMLLFCLICMSGATGAYLQPYQVYNENEKFYSIEEFLQYIPIHHRDFCMVKTRKVVIFQTRVFFVAMIIQIIASVIAKTFSIWCIVYVFIITFIIPIFIVGLSIWRILIRNTGRKLLSNRTKYIGMHDMGKVLARISAILQVIGIVMVVVSGRLIDSDSLFGVGLVIVGIGSIGVLLTR